MTAIYDPRATSPIYNLNYVFEPRWGDAVFEEGDVLQLSDQDYRNGLQITFAGGNKVLLGRASSASIADYDMQDDISDATISTVSREFRQQLLQLVASKESQKRAAELRNTPLPFIDLKPFGADILGVSRKHAILERDKRYVTLTDMGSMNGTRLNGTTLFPLQRRILRNGDKLQFGSLQLWVGFRRLELDE